MAALGGLTVFYLLAPTLVIVPMSFTEARILSFPPEGFSLQWYGRMFTDRQWSTAMLNSALIHGHQRRNCSPMASILR